MLDIDDPLTPHIFAASKQLELIAFYSNRMTLCATSQRSDMFLIIQPAFAALRWLNKTRFDGSAFVDESIALLEDAIGQLSKLTADEDVPPDPKLCPACDEPVTQVEEYRSIGITFSPWQYCSRCSEIVDPAFRRLRSGEFGFGTEFI